MPAGRLRELEAEGVVSRTVHPETPVRIEYGPTDTGHDLEGAVAALSRWADRWVDDPAEAVGEPAGRS